ncbi:hypothetical protein Goshw_015452 [Gossypium schwendimanii]|uniref:EXS domain-containing protein n=1 Tax=Gossypium schwendimanii TaxID=34291 RepID=A0A7J9MXG9_GOSSC|nr:hypothetical protein [Gossypium schwendimanii]
MQTVLNYNVSSHTETLTAIVANLEIISRGIWNFFRHFLLKMSRLENEHLNNVGKFRAFKSVPLLFQL